MQCLPPHAEQMRGPNPPPQNDEGDLRLDNSSEPQEQPLAEEPEIGKCLRLIKYLRFDIFCMIIYFIKSCKILKSPQKTLTVVFMVTQFR